MAWCAVALAAQPKLPSGTPAPVQGPNPFLAQAKELYQKLDFEKCLQRLGQAPQWRSSPKELLEIELYAGMCAYNLNQLPQAEEHFRLALRIAPAAELPPYTSPKLVDFFRRTKRSMPKAAPVRPDKAEKEKAEKEKAEAEKAEKEKAEAARAEKEKAEQLKAEQERAEQERARKAEKPGRFEKTEKTEKADLAEEPPEATGEKPAVATDAVTSGDTPKADSPGDGPPRAADAPVRDEGPKVAEGVRLPPPAAAPPSFIRRHAGPLGVAGAAVVALAVGAGLGVNAKGLESRANQAQYDSDFRSLGASARSSATGANVAYGLAAAAAVGALVWLLLEGL